MKVKKVGYYSCLLDYGSTKIVVDLDKFLDIDKKPPKVSADVVVSTGDKYYGKADELSKDVEKFVSTKNDAVFYITTHGEYAFGDVLVRRLRGVDFYIFDQGNLRIVYIGKMNQSLNEKSLKDLADVDVLIAPINMVKPSEMMKLVNIVDPAIFIPTAFAEYSPDGLELPKIQDFIKDSGLANVEYTSKPFTLKSGVSDIQRILKMVVLE